MNIIVKFFLPIILFFGAIYFSDPYLHIIGFLIALLILYTSFNKTTFKFPNSLVLYELFLIVLLLYQIIGMNSKYSLKFLLLFLSGGVFWIAFYNLKKVNLKFITDLIIVLGLIYLGINIFNSIFYSSEFYYQSLIYQATLNHNHIGDYWVLVALISYSRFMEKKNKANIILLIISIMVIVISGSRSALLSLFVAGFYYIYKNKIIISKQFNYILFTGLILFFFYMSFGKTTIFSRLFLLLPIFEKKFNLFGLGMGNYYKFFQDIDESTKATVGFSSVAHNIVLEVITGIGIFSFTFIVWLISNLKEMFTLNFEHKSNYLFPSLFLAMTINFMFDATYLIPTMFWLWLIFLGLLQSKNSKLSI